MAIIASNDDAKKAQQIQTEKKNEADLDRKEVGEMMPSKKLWMMTLIRQME